MNSPRLVPIAYQDTEILVANKRAGLPSQGGAGVGASADVLLSEQCGQKIYLCHRLDKETEGLLICAKNAAAAAKWTRLVGQRAVKKEYKALCFGAPQGKSGTIDLPIKEKGVEKPARTRWILERIFSEKDFFSARDSAARSLGGGVAGASGAETIAAASDDSGLADAFAAPLGPESDAAPPPGLFPLSLLRLELETGRTHQIRIHLAKSGLPIIGDDKYGNFPLNKAAKKTLGIKRLCLCAFRLSFPAPGGKKTLEIPCAFLP